MIIEKYCVIEYERCFVAYESKMLGDKERKILPIEAGIQLSKRWCKPILTQGLPKSARKYIEKYGYTISVKGNKRFKNYVALVQTPIAGISMEIIPKIYADSKESYFRDGIIMTSVEEGKVISKLLGTEISPSSIRSSDYELVRFMGFLQPLKQELLA